MPKVTNIALFYGALPDDRLVKFNFALSALFLTVTVLLFLFILLSRLRDGIKYARRNKVESAIQHFLSSYLFEENVSETEIKSFCRQYVLKARNRHIVLENLLLLHKSLIGESAEKLRHLYLQLGLHNYSKQKLYSGSWDLIAKGIGELAEMEMREYSSLIRTFVNHPHPVLRSEAQVALLKLKKDGLFALLDDLEEPLMDWQQLQLARAASKAQLLAIPDFKQWLSNREESIVVFSLRMIAYYGQHNALPQILQLLQHPSEKVREEAVITLRHLEAFEAIPILTSLYEHETIEIRLKILKTLAVIGGSEIIPFYELLLKENDKRLQLAAAQAIYMSSNEGKEKLRAIKNDPEHILQALAASALSFR